MTFSASNVLYEEEWEGRSRTILNSDTSCNITYNPWNTPQSYDDSDTSNYETLGSNIILWDDSVTFSDTIPYEIRNGLLYIYPGTVDEYYYRKK